MKKLFFAITGVAAFAAFAADPSAGANDISLVGFENYTADQGVVGKGDDGGTGSSLWSVWSSAGTQLTAADDASLVKTYGNDNATAPSANLEPRPFAGETNTKYLALDTNGNELRRAIQDGGSALAVAATGTYIDTLMQFTASESEPTDINGAKIAIWLGVVNNETNLYVRGGSYSVADLDDADITVTTKSYKLSGNYVPGTWYRLTVKAVASLAPDSWQGSKYPGFQIFIDGTPLTIANDQAYTAMALQWLEDGVLDDSSLLTGGTFIPSAVTTLSTSAATLTAAGFKGTGALDDFVVTTEDPFAAQPIDFTLTWGSGVTAVSYTIDRGEPIAIAAGATSPFHIPGGVEAGSIVAFTFANADGAQKTLTGTAGTDVGIDATGTTFIWADYLGDAVAGAYTIDDANDLDMLRKGVLANLATSNETFKQTANIDMTSAGAFAGIGTYAAAADEGLPFQGEYDGQGYKISNVTQASRSYGGIFNQVRGGTIKNLTVENMSLQSGGSGGFAIVGNAGLGTTLQGLTAMGSFGTAEAPCTHNVAGIAVRLAGGASNVVDGVTMLETLVKDCTNNATLYGSHSKMGGICTLTQDQRGVLNDYVLFDGCVNNGTITASGGSDGIGGIVGHQADGTKLQNCVNNAIITSTLAEAKVGELVGLAYSNYLDDLGGNAAACDKKMVNTVENSAVTGFQFAMVENNVATTVLPPLAANNAYLLEGDVAAGGDPVATLTVPGDEIAFDTALGYTFDGTIANSGEAGIPTVEMVRTLIVYTATAQGTELEPGEQDATVYTTAADATAALANVMIVEPEDVMTNETISAADKARYDDLFEAKVVEVAGGYAIEVGLTTDAECYLQDEADYNAAEIVDAINDSEVTFNTTPGLYYSIKWGTTLAMDQQTEKVLATGLTLTLDLPKGVGATTGFYKVMIDVTK